MSAPYPFLTEAVIDACNLMDRNLVDGDSRMLRENIAGLRFVAQHGRYPVSMLELRAAMEKDMGDLRPSSDCLKRIEEQERDIRGDLPFGTVG